ncbi:MAG: PhzF family phenazine biosynthesis protein [Anaerolineaceae bacterium]|nr:PhzF family phenazine biosynthesis protein [Anaerolineaceae bacterium]MBN2676579.1 PhzF family phenazine biosynthesis protein [Anaerolineaceae bacterium]
MKIYQVDAFTSEPFKGNPAGVCLLEKARPDDWMQSLAMEMNLSETAFVLRRKDVFELRWFTPKKEVRLCGHATLATAHILWEAGILKNFELAQFETLSGRLAARLDKEWIELDFPMRKVEPCIDNVGINNALGTNPIATSISPSEQGDYYLLELAGDAELRSLAPDFTRLEECHARAVIVTSRSSDPQFDFVSRFFAPWLGINEDPVTGSAHCYLTPYWSKKLGKSIMLAYQASERGGVVGCRWAVERVILRGQAVTIFRGELAA